MAKYCITCEKAHIPVRQNEQKKNLRSRIFGQMHRLCFPHKRSDLSDLLQHSPHEAVQLHIHRILTADYREE